MNTSAGAINAPSSTKHPLDEAESALGGRAEMARALNVTPGAIGNWKARGVPIRACVQIEALVPSVTRQRLRPDDFAEIWPELARLFQRLPFTDMPSAVRRAIAGEG